MNSQSAWLTPSGLSMKMRRRRPFPPPRNCTSTISMFSVWATLSATSVTFAVMASLFRSGILLPPKRNKKVGFRPLFAFDNFSIPWDGERVIRALVVIRSSYMATDDILALLIQERDKLNRAIESLQGARQ